MWYFIFATRPRWIQRTLGEIQERHKSSITHHNLHCLYRSDFQRRLLGRDRSSNSIQLCTSRKKYFVQGGKRYHEGEKENNSTDLEHPPEPLERGEGGAYPADYTYILYY